MAEIESECCREDARAWEPCAPFQELQMENELLRVALDPFIRAADLFDNMTDEAFPFGTKAFGVTDLRRAREAVRRS